MKTSKKSLFDKVWKVFRIYILRRDNCICFTCGETANQAGHFIHGKYKPTYFDEKNVHAQCVKCNFFLDGNRDTYLRKLQIRYGIKTADKLLDQKYKTKYWTVIELQELYNKYLKKNNDLDSI